MAGPPCSWKNLPLELTGLVLGRQLPSHVDRVRFAAVRLPPPLPLLALKNSRTFYSMPSGEPLHGPLAGWWYHFEVIKLIVCSSDLIAALFRAGSSNRIAVCHPGASLWSGKLYALDYGEDLLALDISLDDNTGDPQVSRIGQDIKVNYFVDLFSNKFNDPLIFKRMLYLVELGGSLLLVRRSIFHSHPDVAVFVADFAQSRWAKVTTLGDDQVLFLGPCSRPVCMPQCDSTGNRVWFLYDYKDFHHWGEDLKSSSSSDISGMAYHRKPFSPLPMILWRDYLGGAGAAWLFPSN
uniref:KIB1-4 beta-propeller domain-containing protein n=1 Tax=Setaria viridis TaxID=4556 RepID=A0A4U6TV40_SETVI|nr:hypothetical protein SEVIR_8G190200v2 [Setaria viridis]